MIRRGLLPVLGLSCFLGLLIFIYRSVLFEDGQFAWDNASYCYYPLYLRVQQEWESGRWPLWDPGQNGGEPLLGNPIAAVFYPAKVLYTLSTYAWGSTTLRDRPYNHCLCRPHCFVSIVGRDLDGIVFGRTELCVWGAGPVPVLQRRFSGRCGLGALGSLCVRQATPPAAALGWGRGRSDPGASRCSVAILRRPILPPCAVPVTRCC